MSAIPEVWAVQKATTEKRRHRHLESVFSHDGGDGGAKGGFWSGLRRVPIPMCVSNPQ